MPFQNIPESDLSYGLISFDKSGKEREDDPDGPVLSKKLIEKVKEEKPTDLFLFSHGWKGDVPSAIDQYNRWIGAMGKLSADRAKMGADFQPLFIGLHWPSQPWGDESLAGPASFSSTEIPQEPRDPGVLFAGAVEHFGGTPEVAGFLRVIFDQWEENPASIVVPPESLEAYEGLANAIGFSAGAGPDAAPDEEGEALDPQAAAQANRIIEAGAHFGIGSFLKKGILGGLRQLSFWTMKKRARSIGEGGMHNFVKTLLAESDAHVHLMGHSFGCVIVSSILGGPNAKGTLPRKVASTVLVQGAVSLWSWGSKVKNLNKPGYFHSIIENGWVSGPVVTTRSVNDKAVGLAYPAAVALVGEAAFDPNTNDLPLFGGVGAYGLQGAASSESLLMKAATDSYSFQKGRIYNLECNEFIPSHSGIDGPEVAHAIWEAAAVGRRP